MYNTHITIKINYMEKNCIICGKLFKVKHNSTGKYCSYECSYKGRKVKRIEIKCGVCGKKIVKKETDKTKYCSRECYGKMKKIRGDKVVWTEEAKKRISERYKGAGNPMYGKKSWNSGKRIPRMSGENHPNWKRGYYINEDGYKIISRERREHRIIMEKHLGRKLKKEEIIHHINNNKTDNRIENLMICTRVEHINIHREDSKRKNKGATGV